jgi:hypothetical protein
MRTRGSSGWSPSGTEIVGFLLIVVGVVYLLGNANVISISWGELWPLILVAVGALILVRAMRPAEPPLTGPGPLPAPGVGTPPDPGEGLAGASGAPPPGPAPAGRGTASLLVPREGAQQLDLAMAVGAGTFRVAGGSTELVDVRSSREDIYSRVERSGARTYLRLRQDASWLPWSFRGGTEWGVRLAEDVPTVFTLNAGAGDFTIDLSRLRIVDAGLSIGAAQARVVLPRPTGEVSVRLTAGASTVTIEIPPGVEARVRSEGGLLRFEGRGETADYERSRDRVSVSISGGASSVRVL